MFFPKRLGCGSMKLKFESQIFKRPIFRWHYDRIWFKSNQTEHTHTYAMSSKPGSVRRPTHERFRSANNQRYGFWMLKHIFSSNNKTESTNPNAPTQATSACVIATTHRTESHMMWSDIFVIWAKTVYKILQVVFAAAQQGKNTHVRPTVPTPNRQKHLPEVQFTFTVRNQHHVLHKISSIMEHASLIPSSVVPMIEVFWAWLQVRTQLPMHLLHSKKLLLWGQPYRSASPT